MLFRDEKENTLLVYAVKQQHQKAVAYLAQRGVDPSSKNAYGDTALRTTIDSTDISFLILWV